MISRALGVGAVPSCLVTDPGMGKAGRKVESGPQCGSPIEQVLGGHTLWIS